MTIYMCVCVWLIRKAQEQIAIDFCFNLLVLHLSQHTVQWTACHSTVEHIITGNISNGSREKEYIHWINVRMMVQLLWGYTISISISILSCSHFNFSISKRKPILRRETMGMSLLKGYLLMKWNKTIYLSML